jgi:ectoine hydroxylase-related dioxygenase (phytanoyl-CoA dioxygenase family)
VTLTDSRRPLEPRWLADSDCDVNELRALVATETDLATYPHASDVVHNVPVYDMGSLQSAVQRVAAVGGPARKGLRALQAELAGALEHGPGIVVLAGAFDPDVVDPVTVAFERMIADERAGDGESGDHFAAAGANDRVWNALEKLAVLDPEAFVDYYGNASLALVCEAWLGPAYQVTSQVNVVRPGGKAQSVHRDYHLGFLDNETAAAYPAHVHRLSPVLTLQGAVAHCDMPVESGPTLYLPHSQKYLPGYLAWRLPEFVEFFAEHHVQLSLAKGDAVFFNPALFHAAGENRSSDLRRTANLLQVSSAFGVPMESVDRHRMVTALFPVLLRRAGDADAEPGLRNAVAAMAAGYPFPTNLDLDPPLEGLAPRSQAALVMQAVEEQWAPDRLEDELAAYDARRRTVR